jgi:RsiW-degrading membrane proteinase PrsW (M82 family)
VRYLPWLLVLALVPLAWPGESDQDRKDFVQGATETIRAMPGHPGGPALREYKFLEGSIEKVFAELPEQKVAGAFLSRRTLMHWAFAAGAAALFGLLLFAANAGGGTPWRGLAKLALASALAGGAFLVLVELCIEPTWQWRFREGPYSLLLAPLANCLRFAFRGAMSPGNGPLASFLGFTLVAGLLMELIKAIPVVIYYCRPREQNWRAALLLGLACGAAFGIVEGLVASSQLYNGVHGLGTYLIAFLSSVALQAVWTGSFAVAVHHNRARLQSTASRREHIFLVLSLLFVPLALHGLYDTLLKMHWVSAALAVGMVSFVYLGALVRGTDRSGVALLESRL